MKAILATSLLALSVCMAQPASAQRLELGPDGPGVDVGPRRDRDLDRRDMRRDVERREMRRDPGERRRGPDAADDDDDAED